VIVTDVPFRVSVVGVDAGVAAADASPLPKMLITEPGDTGAVKLAPDTTVIGGVVPFSRIVTVLSL
jgi:hypothetical protein